MKISPARSAAFDVLLKIEIERAFSSILLPIYESALSPRDRALCHELTLGVLRRQMYLDRVIRQYSGNKRIDPAVSVALRLGAYQLLFLDKTPAYSAINESVALTSRAKKSSAKGFVNAILRRVAQEPISLEFTDDVERMAVETSHPRWLIERWIAEFGERDTRELAEGNNVPPALAFRLTVNGLNRLDGQREWTGSTVVERGFVAGRSSADLLEFASRGEIYFQDEASQLVAEAVELRDGGRFLDLCAAPGSKTTAIGASYRSSNVQIVAGDLYEHRVRSLRENCLNQGERTVQVLRYDAELDLPFSADAFDTVLVDAPCSGTGTIRHNPEIRYFLEPSDFAEFQSKQLAILRNASQVVKTGGALIYSTCSLERDENEDVCDRFLSETGSFARVDPKVPQRFLTPGGYARTFPWRDRVDGFFIAEFRRVS